MAALSSTEDCLPEYCRSGVGKRIFIAFSGASLLSRAEYELMMQTPARGIQASLFRYLNLFRSQVLICLLRPSSKNELVMAALPFSTLVMT